MEKNSERKLNRLGDKRGMDSKSRDNLSLGRKFNDRAKKEFLITPILREMANEKCPDRWLEAEDKGKGLTWRQAVSKRMWLEAVKGNAKVTSEILDRLEGKVVQPIGTDDELGDKLNGLLVSLRGFEK